ncbi:bifunctional riboflavin kinase/FAD synthetase [Aestuariicella hydrocarbonica]|uniref:Riboflavin biosynthesis protein n=1 Tax=Pseudomaricurvus hydrocarbonicus TaxID=1470433 RepID=A0A9E5MJD4_9GAMM|nr:bifunctional riboflavin kinase/FAD synthetase [Aestuariicella hydrocarbonica]NHO64944.1 bifunctional riboflavin kinase/FAD synthetase [Aestuariicella hydrocarbonica]
MHNLRPLHHGSVVTIGSFDGVHLGHQAIIRQVTEKAAELNLPSVVVVFEPQPHEFFSAEQAPARLMRLREKAFALFEAGIDRVCCLQFNQALRSLSAEEFVQQILVDGLGVKHLIVGDDFRFGKDRCGGYSYLAKAGQKQGFEVCDTHTFEVDGERVSSTRIRKQLELANFEEAARLLGKPYTISGHVGYGQQLGRTLGVPTANVHLQRYRSPLQGVFAVRATLPDGRVCDGVANVGVRPTIGEKIKPILEVHLLDFTGSLYGKILTVEFLHKLREEKKFASVDLLKAQIYRDIDEAKAYFALESTV